MANERTTPPGHYDESFVFPQNPLQAPDHTRSFFVQGGESAWLPPLEYRRQPDERIPTPVDERGLVLLPELIEAVKSTVDPVYVWPQGRQHESTHHLYYEKGDYPREDGNEFDPYAFRNLAIHKVELPRVFENWLHLVAEKPQRPSREVMAYRIESWRVAKELFRSASSVVLWEKHARRRQQYAPEEAAATGDLYAIEYMEEVIDRHLRGVDRHIDALQRIPPEFRLVEPANTPRDLARELGRFVRRHSMLGGRYIHAPQTLAA